MSGNLSSGARSYELKLDAKSVTVCPPLEVPSDSSWVYVLHRRTRFGRLVGESDILYIGQGDAKRVKSFEDGRHSVIGRLRRLVGDSTEVFDLSVAPVASSALEESRRLQRYLEEHCELPPLNRRSEGYLVGRFLAAIFDQRDVPGQFRYRAFPHGSGDGTCSVLNIWTGERGAPEGWSSTLVWVWPESWNYSLNRTASLKDYAGYVLLVRPSSKGCDLPEELGQWRAGARIVRKSSEVIDLTGLTKVGLEHERVLESCSKWFGETHD